MGRLPKRDERGVEIVELALVLPIFLLVVIASLSFTWLTFLKTAAAQAAKEGARYASVSLACPTATQPCPVGQRTYPDLPAVASHVNDRVPVFGFSAGNLDITYAWSGQSCELVQPADPTKPIPTCSPPPSSTVMVSVTKDVPAPFRFFAGVFGSPDTITATSTGETRAE